PRGEVVRPPDLVRVNDMTQILGCKAFGARGKVAGCPGAWRRAALAAAVPGGVACVGKSRSRQGFAGRPGGWSPGAPKRLHPTHAPTEPEGVEQGIEAMPIPHAGTDQASQGRPEPSGAARFGRGKDAQRIAAFGEAHMVAIVAQEREE